MSSNLSGLRDLPTTSTRQAPTIHRMDEWIGNTPLVRLTRLADPKKAPIFIKMENLNPSGSMRDRYVAEILERACLAGELVEGDTIALAGLDDSAVGASCLANILNLKTKIYVPKNANKRLFELLDHYGAEIVWTDADKGLEGAIEQAAGWARQAPDRMYVDGYRRQAVRDAYTAIADEILQALDGVPLGAFITSVTTGGTFREVARELRETHPSLHVGGAALIDFDMSHLHDHQFNVLKRMNFDEVWDMRNAIATTDGLLLGPKGAACVKLALELQNELPSDEIIVALNPDSGQRYLGWEDKFQL